MDFFGGFFFNGRRVCGSLQLYQRQEFKNKLLLMLFAIQVQNTGHIFLLLVCIVALGHKKHVSRPRPCPKTRHTCFSFYILCSNFPPENGAKTFSSPHSDIRYRPIRKNSFIRVQVICGVKLLRPWYDSIVPESITIANLFDMVQTGMFDSSPPIINSLRDDGLLDENDDSQHTGAFGRLCICVYMVLILP